VTNIRSLAARFKGSAVSMAGISGRVANAGGRGISGALVRINHPAFAAPIYARTNGFGYYHSPPTPIDNDYILNIISKTYTFADPYRTIDLSGDLTDIDFVSQQ
jgi:hypothetical protein